MGAAERNGTQKIWPAFPRVVMQHWVQDIICTHPQDLQQSSNRHKDLHCVDVVDALVLPLSPSVNPL